MKRLLCLLLTLAVLASAFAGCGNENMEIATAEPTAETEILPENTPEKVITVSTVGEFLSALNSDTTIRLEAGDYLLSSSADYGRLSDNPAYYWEDMGDGFQLKLNHLHDLVIEGAGLEKTQLLAEPRYANVLSLEGCQNVRIRNLTAGHTQGAEMCSGGVIDLYNCKNIGLQSLGLFGCGVTGVRMYGCENVGVEDSRIYECSITGADVQSSVGVQFFRCDFYTIGTPQAPAMAVFSMGGCQRVILEDCSISENNVMNLLGMSYSQEVSLKNCEMRANQAVSAGFDFMECRPVFENCSFEGNDLRIWYLDDSYTAVTSAGKPYDESLLPEIVLPEPVVVDGLEQVVVTNVDELLQAIGPDRDILLQGEVFDITAACADGISYSPYYYWEETYDGPQLVICDVSNLSIRAEGTDLTAVNLNATPRYANVLSFRNCQNLNLSGFTAGHSEAPGECAGGVLDFTDCINVVVDHCGLYGCGILGVNVAFSSVVSVVNCDIYDCSYGGIRACEVDGLNITENTFRNLGGPEVDMNSCTNVNTDAADIQQDDSVG